MGGVDRAILPPDKVAIHARQNIFRSCWRASRDIGIKISRVMACRSPKRRACSVACINTPLRPETKSYGHERRLDIHIKGIGGWPAKRASASMN